MRTIGTNYAWWTALCLAALVTPALAQDQPPARKAPARPAGATRMEIYNGPDREVRYFGGAPGDRATLMQLERSENNLSYARNVEELKRQYVNSERILEPQRRYVQEQLYGTSITYSHSNSFFGFGSYGGWPGSYYPYAYPYYYGGYDFGPGWGGFGGGAFTLVTRSLAYGVGDEGRLKDAMVQVIARDAASPDFIPHAYHDYAAAMHAAASNAALARDLNLTPAAEGPAPAPAQAPVAVTLKGGETIEGRKMSESGDWYVLEQDGGNTVKVRKSEVTRILENKPAR